MKKRITALCFTMLLVFALAGCRHTDSTDSPYALSDNWAYLETGETASADVFFICPTVYGGNENSFNMPLDDEASKADFLGATNMEKGIYDEDTRLFAPYYRQMGIYGYSFPASER